VKEKNLMGNFLKSSSRHNVAMLLLGISVLLIVAGIFVHAKAEVGRRAQVQYHLLPGNGGADTLVVLVHGFAGGRKAIWGVEQAVRQKRPDADLMVIEYDSNILSNGDPCRLAWQMQEEIGRVQAERRSRHILLCGYSLGALLMRKAYVYGWGFVEDAPTGGRQKSTQPVQEWVRHVDRFVLLCGVNRGWSFQNAGPIKRYAEAAKIKMARAIHVAELARSCERGEPFVANLRLQWLEVTRHVAATAKNPTVIQLLGDIDDFVSKEDSRDVTVARDFIWVTVNNTGHADMVQLGDTGTGLERKRKIQQAFGDDGEVEQLRRVNPSFVLDEDRDVKAVVFVLHGIRDMGEWTSRFEAPLQQAYSRKNPDGRSKMFIQRAGYGWFAMGPFLIWADRQKNVRWFMDQVTEATAKFPNLQEIDFIGHSNGTYILASSLKKYATLKVNRVALAGSVIPRDFPWSEFQGRVGQVRNYVGASDWVVGLFPRLFETPIGRFFNEDIGSAGFNGFQDGSIKSMETEFVRGAHGAALQKENIQSIVDFIIDGKKTDSAVLHVESHPGWLEVLSNICWIVWLLLAGVVVAGLWWVGRFAASHSQRRYAPWACRAVYLLLVWLLLNTL
jgi:pimeloyl-ACP methyl ester carboxylesterase